MRNLFLIFCTVALTAVASAQGLTISLDPLTFLGLFVTEDGEQDIRNLWLCAEVSGTTAGGRELGAGLFLRGDRVALRGQWRGYYNQERQSGAFWGLYGLLEYRRMYWVYDDDGELGIGFNFPFQGDKVYHSLGITAGVDGGFRIRGESIGVTFMWAWGRRSFSPLATSLPRLTGTRSSCRTSFFAPLTSG